MTEFRGVLPNHFNLPEQIDRLGELSYNLWWVWEKEAQRLQEAIEKDVSSDHNYWDDIKLVHNALPEIQKKDIDLSIIIFNN